MMTKTDLDEAMQLLRSLKTAQFRKQLEHDNKKRPIRDTRYWDAKIEEWIPRSVVIQDFLRDAKEQT